MDENARCVFYVEKWENAVSGSQAKQYILLYCNQCRLLFVNFSFSFPRPSFFVATFLLYISGTLMHIFDLYSSYKYKSQSFALSSFFSDIRIMQIFLCGFHV